MLFRFWEMVTGSYGPDADDMSLHNGNIGKNFAFFYSILLKNMGEYVILSASSLFPPLRTRQ